MTVFVAFYIYLDNNTVYLIHYVIRNAKKKKKEMNASLQQSIGWRTYGASKITIISLKIDDDVHISYQNEDSAQSRK